MRLNKYMRLGLLWIWPLALFGLEIFASLCLYLINPVCHMPEIFETQQHRQGIDSVFPAISARKYTRALNSTPLTLSQKSKFALTDRMNLIFRQIIRHRHFLMGLKCMTPCECIDVFEN